MPAESIAPAPVTSAQPVATPPSEAAAVIGLSLPWVVMLALGILFLVSVIRALPFWSEAARSTKPLNCDTCMVFWVSVGLGIVSSYGIGTLPTLIHLIPACGLAMLGLAVLHHFRAPWEPPK